jgi:hypothetical protein
VACGQPVLGHPRGRRARQLADELPVAGHLERGETLGGERPQFVKGHAGTGGGHNERLHVVLGQLGLHPDHRAFQHRRVRPEHLLDLERRQVLAPPAQHLLLPAHERVRAVVTGGDQVAGAQPAIVEQRGGLLRHPPVPGREHRVAQLDLAGLTRPQQAPVRGDHPRLVHGSQHRMLAHGA